MARRQDFRNNNSRYQFEFGSEGWTSNKVQQKKNPRSEALKYDPVATGQNIAGAFTNDVLNNHASEFGLDYEDHEVKSMSKQTKERFQEDLKQNFNVEIAEEHEVKNANK